MEQYKLPYQDRLGFCNVFISAIGGDGANMAAKLLFKIAVTAIGLDGGYDARYGSEKKGTATDVSLKLCQLGTPLRESGPTTIPHILAAFHAGLIRPLKMNRGLQENATVIVNTTQTPDEIRETLQLQSGTIICFDAAKIADETNSRLNMPMMAMLCKVLNFPDDVVINMIENTWPRAKEANVAAYKAATSQFTKKEYAADGKYELVAPSIDRGQLGYLNMLNGGAIDALTHSTANRDNRIAGYGFVPVFNPEACIGCAICMTVCSDPGGIIWKNGKVVGVDTAFCKGCMRCVEVCPTTKKGKALALPAEMEV
jgi:pyruvate ferredoxin oxidoreductase gamma subunit